MLSAIKDLVKQLARTCGYKVAQVTNTQFFDFEALLHYQLEKSRPFRLVQIGACDGVSYDPIFQFIARYHRQIQGVVIEPLPDLFRQLQQTYRPFPQITPVNCAVHNTAPEMVLYRVDPEKLSQVPDWARGIASFDLMHHVRLGIPSECIINETVPCRPLSEILAAHQFSTLDLLQIDTEGYDAEILLGLDFKVIQPRIIRFEHGRTNHSITYERFLEVIDRLHAAGYEVLIDQCDAIAIHHSIAFGALAEPSLPISG